MRKVALVLVAALTVAPGCSLMVGSRQPLTVTATDPRAEIYVDNQHVGTGMVVTPVRRDESHAVIARVGDRAGTASITVGTSTAGVLDTVGCVLFILPCIGLIAPGSSALQPSTVAISVPPEAASR